MSRIPGIRRLFRLPSSDRRVAGEVEDEIAFHLEERTRQLAAQGMNLAAARAAALREFGDVHEAETELEAIARRRARMTRRANWWSDLRQDVHYGVRSAVRAPLFSLLAIITLALGIGANAAVFGVVKSVLLNSLPYGDASRLVRIYTQFEHSAIERSSVSPGAASDFAERLRSFSAVTPFNFTTFGVALVDNAGSRVLSAAQVGTGFFSTLQVRAALGRTLTEGDASTPVVMLSHAAWHREFGADPDIIGRTLRVDFGPYEVVGVLPHDFVGPMGKADMLFPLDLKLLLRDPRAREQHWLGVAARLTPGVRVDAAQREIDRLAAELMREHPQSHRGVKFLVLPLHDAMVGETRTPLLVLMASAGLVLLITCANLAGALLSRTLSRRKEFAVRAAIGAKRSRLVRQLLTESLLLALAGAGIGILLAVAGLAMLRGMSLPMLPAYATLSLDGGAVFVTLFVALFTGVAFGLAPALSIGRWDPQGTLREESGRSSEGGRTRHLRGILVAAQLALSLSLLAGTGLLVRSLWAMTTAPLGFEPDGVLTGRVQIRYASYPTPAARRAFFEQLEQRLAALGGVRGVASVTQIPSPTMSSNVLTIEGIELEGDGPTFIPYMAVSPSYFRTMGISLLQGRTFEALDTPDAPPAIVISETMAKRYWTSISGALGARIRISPHTAERWGTVIGVVRDVRVDPALPAPQPMAYATNRQDHLSRASGRDFLVRTDGDPLTLLRPFQAVLAALDPALPLRDPMTLRTIVDGRFADRRVPVLLMTAFGVLALILASVGVYAMFASMAAAREREFAVRVALGSSRRAIAALVLQQGAVWMAVGGVGAVFGVAGVSRLLSGQLYGIPPFDMLAIGGSVGIVLACAAVALLAPVRRATGVDPITVLR